MFDDQHDCLHASVGSRCFVSQTSSHACHVSRHSQHCKCFGSSLVQENMRLLSECRQASERQELAFACTPSAGVFSAVALAWNLGYQCCLRVFPASLRCRVRPSHVGEVRVGNGILFLRTLDILSPFHWGSSLLRESLRVVPWVADRVGKAFVDRRGWLWMNLAVLLLGTKTLGSPTIRETSSI